MGDLNPCVWYNTSMPTKDPVKRREQWRKHYAKNRQKYIDKASRYKKLLQLLIKKVKESRPCADCKKKYPYYVMDFDHREDKLFNIGGCYTNTGMAKLKEEINKCDLVCSNCHRIRTHGRLGLSTNGRSQSFDLWNIGSIPIDPAMEGVCPPHVSVCKRLKQADCKPVT